MLALLVLTIAFAVGPAARLNAQPSASAKACRCAPGRHRHPRFFLPIAGIGILPLSIASRDSQLPSVTPPSLVDIRDQTPRNALEGERLLAMGALAPDTATSLPTFMLVAAVCLVVGGCLLLPRRRRRRRAGWRLSGGGTHGGWKLGTVRRRRVGLTIAGAGGLMLLLGSREYVEGAQAQQRARAEWIQMGQAVVRVDSVGPNVGFASDTDSATRDSTPTESVTTRSLVPLPALAPSARDIPVGAPVARLLIPAIDLDEIVVEGVGPVELNGGPGHFPGSVLPGDSGNSIISAHRDRHFRRVGELAVGSRIRTETRDGAVEWVVTARRIVSRDTPSLFEESDATLTLTTCWPLRYFGPAPDRLLIIAKRA